jgi:ubiquinone/menaquinone biosynthesis C-methylase UbiE
MKVAAVREKQTEQWYEHYYTTKGDDRSDALRNPGVLFQNLAFEKSIVEALRRLPGDKRSWKILDVGCGAGFSMLRLLSHGLEPECLCGIDIEQSRIDRGLRRFPALNLLHGDASDMDFESNSFDLAMESTMFVQLTDEPMAQGIANEMLRVVKPGGYIMLTDWRYSFGRPGYRALSRTRIANLFGVGTRSSVVCRRHGALIPVLGRALSQYASSLYFPLCKLLPPLVGQLTVILQKSKTQ